MTTAVDMGVSRALAAIATTHAAAAERQLRVAVAVVGHGGDVVAFARMDGTVPVAVRLSLAKARAAAGFGADTARLAGMANEAPGLAGAFASALGSDMAFVPGGVPVMRDGLVCGAVGVGGAAPGEDHELATVCAASLGGVPAA